MEDADIGMADATKPSGLRRRLDPRSGKYVLMQPESFWRDHETRRRADGASVADYCEANGLARSTFQRWVSRLAGGSARRVCRSVGTAQEKAPAAGFLSMPIRSPAATPEPQASRSAQIEIDAGDGATVRLYDEAARSAIALVLSRLRGSR